MKQHSFKSIVADYARHHLREEFAGMWGVVLFFRLPGFLVARLAISFGVSATSLTACGLIATILMPVASILLPGASAIIAIALLSVLFQVLDCADGTVARATATVSLSGRFFDFLSDILFRVVCMATIGHAVDTLAPDATLSWLAFGLAAGFCATYARLMRCYVNSLTANADALQKLQGRKAAPYGLLAIAYGFLSGLDQLFALIALLAWPYGGLGPLMIGGLVYHAADAIIAGGAGLAVLRATDRRAVSR